MYLIVTSRTVEVITKCMKNPVLSQFFKVIITECMYMSTLELGNIAILSPLCNIRVCNINIANIFTCQYYRICNNIAEYRHILQVGLRLMCRHNFENNR